MAASDEERQSLLALPVEVLVDGVLALLNAAELCRVGAVCRALHSCVQSSILWQRLLEREFWWLPQTLRCGPLDFMALCQAFSRWHKDGRHCLAC